MEVVSFAKNDILLVEIESIDNILLNYAHLKTLTSDLNSICK